MAKAKDTTSIWTEVDTSKLSNAKAKAAWGKFQALADRHREEMAPVKEALDAAMIAAAGNKAPDGYHLAEVSTRWNKLSLRFAQGDGTPAARATTGKAKLVI